MKKHKTENMKKVEYLMNLTSPLLSIHEDLIVRALGMIIIWNKISDEINSGKFEWDFNGNDRQFFDAATKLTSAAQEMQSLIVADIVSAFDEMSSYFSNNHFEVKKSFDKAKNLARKSSKKLLN